MSRIGVIGITFLIVALILAGVQLLTYRRALHNSGEFVGEFPANMSAINDLLQRAQYKLIVVNDFCDYGHYSHHADYKRYTDLLLEAKKKSVRIEMHVYTADVGAKMTASQFGLQDPKTADTVFATIHSSGLYKSYLDIKKQEGQTSDFAKYTDFLSALASDEDTCIKQFRDAQIDIRDDVASPLPLFTWIRDDSEAIFSIYNLGHDSREVSQRTENHPIVMLLGDIDNKLAQGQ
jgi:hypothetical protein